MKTTLTTNDQEQQLSLYAALGTDRLPDETSMEGIKAEQVSIARTDAMTPFEFVGGVYDQKIANMLAQLNTLLAPGRFGLQRNGTKTNSGNDDRTPGRADRIALDA